MQALLSLDRAGRTDARRLVVLRSASDYTFAPEGVALGEWFFHDDTHMCFDEALDALLLAGTPVVHAAVAFDASSFERLIYRAEFPGEPVYFY